MTRETSAFDRIGSSRLPSTHKGYRFIVNTIVIALLAFLATWWFGLH